MKWVIRGVGLVLFAIISVYLIADLQLKPLGDDARVKAPGAFIELSDGQIHYRLEGPEDGP
ncbi:MAG: alpha/beta hydrolase, partial [Pseudomonadota bacterium]